MDAFLPLFAYGFVIGLPIGALVGFLIPVRRRWSAVPALGFAVAWFIWAAWLADDESSDLDRTGRVILAALIVGGVYVGFVAALGTGRRARSRLSARRRSTKPS